MFHSNVKNHIVSDGFISILVEWAHILDVVWVVSSDGKVIGRVSCLDLFKRRAKISMVCTLLGRSLVSSFSIQNKKISSERLLLRAGFLMSS